MPLGNRDHGYLYGREPNRERSGVVFDQDAEEALDRAVEGAVDHERLFAGTVFGYVFEIETLRQVEVELHGRELPQAPDGIDQLDIDLRSVKRGLARNRLVLDVQLFQHFFERAGRHIPLVFTSDKALAVVWIPGGKFGLEFIKAEVFQHVAGELHAIRDFLLNLVGSAEDVSVVLGKAADAQQAVHDARAFIAVDCAEFAEAHGQIAIGAQRIFVNENVARAVHGLYAVFGVVKFHKIEKVLGVIALVARGEEKLAAHHVRRVDQGIAALNVL